MQRPGQWPVQDAGERPLQGVSVPRRGQCVCGHLAVAVAGRGGRIFGAHREAVLDVSTRAAKADRRLVENYVYNIKGVGSRDRGLDGGFPAALRVLGKSGLFSWACNRSQRAARRYG